MTKNFMSACIRRTAMGGLALIYAAAGNQARAFDTFIGTSRTYNGVVYNSAIKIGSGSNPLFTVNSSAALTSDKGVTNLYVGDDNGPGRLLITNGGIVENSGEGRVGNVGKGVATVTGANSRWNISGALTVGHANNDTLTVEAGGKVTSALGAIVGSSSMSTVTVTGMDSEWSSGGVTVGFFGNGTINVEAGGTVSLTGGTVVGSHFGNTCLVTVTGADSQWNSIDEIFVGDFGNGTFNVADGGTVSSAAVVVGSGAGSTGSTTITGVGSRWDNTAGVIVGSNGSGTLNVEAGGKVMTTWAEFGGIVGLNSGSTGTVTVTGADSEWDTGYELSVGHSGNGTLNIEAGGQVTNPIYGYVGKNAGSTGNVTVTGTNSRWTTLTSFYIGNSGNGTLSIEDRGTVTGQNGYIGANSGSTGNVTVKGFARWNNSADLYVGNSGNGTLNVEAGGTVANQNGYIGANLGSSGTVTVSGANANWNSSGSIFIGGNGGSGAGVGSLSIANSGQVTVAGTTKLWNTGTLTLLNGGTLNTQHFDASVGNFNFSGGILQVSGTTTVSGALTVSGGSTFFNNGTIAAPVVVGSGGFVKGTGNFGSLTVASGGIASPGLSPGRMTDTSTVWSSGGTYLWEINRLATNGGVAGLGLGWDLWNTGALTIDGAFTISLTSPTVSGSAGVLSNWSAAAPLSWEIATANNGAFASVANLSVNSQAFQQFNSLDGGGFSLTGENNGNSLVLRFTPAIVVEGGQLNNSSTSLQGNSLSAGNGASLEIGSNAAIAGFGSISPPGNTQTISNSGTISANVPGQTLSISSNTFVNQGGTVQATDGGILKIDANNYTQTSGTTNLGTNGTVTSPTFEIQGGTLSGSGTIDTTLVNNGTISPGNSPGMIEITEDLVLESNSVLNIELAGLIQGTQYDYLSVSQHATLDGTLAVSFLGGFQNSVNAGSVFSILTSGDDLTGVFQNVADGGRLSTPYGSFLVSYGGSSVVLSNFEAVPEPRSLVLAAIGLVGLIAVARRHTRQCVSTFSGVET